jgi:hypothetical protein
VSREKEEKREKTLLSLFALPIVVISIQNKKRERVKPIT